MARIKCSVLDRNKEKVFVRLATRGVVKFFNVCNQEQKEIEGKIKTIAGNSVRKRDKILQNIDKKEFLDRLKEDDDDESENFKKDQKKPAWNVLRDDFLMGAKLKDWQKDNNDNEQQENTNNKKLIVEKEFENGNSSKVKK